MMLNDVMSGDALAAYEAREELQFQRAQEAHIRGIKAYSRLLALVENSDSGQPRIVSKFLASIYNSYRFKFDMTDLRRLDEDIGNDILICIDAHRWGIQDLNDSIQDGNQRIHNMLKERGFIEQ
ncbi:hypothetical protein LNV47_19180 [Paucibacter sp. DJ4R-1]|nr:hypothetical protein [Paucibacter sp. DJ4R-1]